MVEEEEKPKENKTPEIKTKETIEDSEIKPKEPVENSEEPEILEDNLESEKRKSAEELLEGFKSNQEIQQKQNSQLKWAFILMLAMIAIVVLIPFIRENFIDKFNYNGLDFKKTQLGELTFFTASFPVIDIQGNTIGNYGVNFRNDPRDLEYITLDLPENKIDFAIDEEKYGKTFISLNPFMEKCNNTLVAAASLSGFLGDSGLEVKSAVTDKAYARTHNETQKWCTPFETVIVITEGNETKISKIGNHCYQIQFTNCEVLQATEKFTLTVLEEYASRFNN